MISASVKITLDEATPKLVAIRDRDDNFRPVFVAAKEELKRANAKNFATNGLPVGGWDPRTRDYAWPLLRRTGKLFESLMSLNSAQNQVMSTSAVFSTDVEYAKFHQYGTRNMPKRQILFEPAGFAAKMAYLAGKYYVNGTVL